MKSPIPRPKLVTDAVDSQFKIDSDPYFLLEETPDFYLVAIDIPSLPAQHPKVLTKEGTLSVEGESIRVADGRQIYFQFHSTTKASQTVYKDGVLWLVLPKNIRSEKILGETA